MLYVLYYNFIKQQEKPKRKTHTSTEVKERFIKKTYKPYTVNFRKVEDAEVIELVEAEKAKGYGNREAFKRLILKK